MTELERMQAGGLYASMDPELCRARRRARDLIHRYNHLSPSELSEQGEGILRTLLGSVGTMPFLEPNFRCDYGFNIHLGDRFYANFDCIILDICPVHIGSNVLFGPRVSVFTASHPLDAEVRNTGLECGSPITIGDNVWVGGHTVINPGVTIGSGTIIGSGSVVTKDIPAGVIAVGNPCKVLRPLTDADRAYWKQQELQYRAEHTP